MPNRAQKRKANKSNKKKNEIKKVEKKSNLKDKLGLTDELYSFIKTLIIVIISFLIVLCLTLLLNHYGVFEKGYTKPEIGETNISYDEILIGTVFNKSDSEYYVIFDDFGGKTKDVYLESKIASYTGTTPIYKVDMFKEINKNNKSENGNPNASTSNELQINGTTLIKINNGRNVLYLEGTDNIISELYK